MVVVLLKSTSSPGWTPTRNGIGGAACFWAPAWAGAVAVAGITSVLLSDGNPVRGCAAA